MLRFYARSSRETENCVSDLCVCRRHCSKSTWLFIRFVGSIAIGISRQILHIKTRRSGWNKFRNFAIRSSLYDARKSNLRVCMYEWNYIHIYIYIYQEFSIFARSRSVYHLCIRCCILCRWL